MIQKRVLTSIRYFFKKKKKKKKNEQNKYEKGFYWPYHGPMINYLKNSHSYQYF